MLLTALFLSNLPLFLSLPLHDLEEKLILRDWKSFSSYCPYQIIFYNRLLEINYMKGTGAVNLSLYQHYNMIIMDNFEKSIIDKIIVRK